MIGKNTVYRIVLFSVFLALFSCEQKQQESVNTSLIDFTVKSTMPHDISSFTQGLVIHDGQLYESTGQEGSSWIGMVDVATGVAEKKVILESAFFGEGITILNNKIYQLTWKNKVGFIYDLRTFKRIGEFSYPGEGWGITHDSTNLIMSDGSSRLIYLDTTSLKPVKYLDVYDSRGSVPLLNELEYAEGYLYANVWQTSRIAKIDPANGKVAGYLDLTLLRDQSVGRNPSADVLNGIAWHKTSHSLLVTGKFWPSIFVLRMKNDAAVQ